MTDMAGAVVAGYDGSSEAAAAVDWAAAEASRLRKPLMVVNAASSIQPIVGVARTPGRAGGAEEPSRELAEAGAERARRGANGISVEAVYERSGASTALERMSKAASLIVVGDRGRGLVSGGLLGSVALALATHAHSPMVVIRGSTPTLPGDARPVAVGLDGSGNAALDYATDVAADTGADLRILVAWQASPVNPGNRADLVNVQARDEAATEAQQEASTIAEKAAERASTRRPDLSAAQPVVLAGRPEQLLIDASAVAALVVVGARGRGDLDSLLLGSVSRGVVYRAECPVAVIR